MGHTSGLLLLAAALAVGASSCADAAEETDGGPDPATESTSTAANGVEQTAEEPDSRAETDRAATTEPPVTMAPTTVPSTSAPGTEPGPDFTEWANQLVEAFAAHDAEQQRLDDEIGETLGMLPEDADQQDMFGLLAEHHRQKATVTEHLLDSLATGPPEGTPAEVAAATDTTVTALRALPPVRRELADAFEGGDVDEINQVVEEKDALRAAYQAECAELQFQLRDLGFGLVECGIDGEDPSVISFEEGPTIGADDIAVHVEAPPGSYTMDYIGGQFEAPQMIIGLDSPGGWEVATSPEIIEVADGDASIRAYPQGSVADVTDLRPDSIMNFWPLDGNSPEAWVQALGGVVVTDTGSGSVAGGEGKFWDLTSERDDPIAILGDGEDWIDPETVLEPGRTIRLWWLDVDGWSVLLTEHVAGDRTLDDAATELAALREALSIRQA